MRRTLLGAAILTAVSGLGLGAWTQQDLKTIHGTVRVQGAAPRAGWIDFEIDNMQGVRRAGVLDGRWSIEIAGWNEIVGIGRMQLDERDAYRPEPFPRIDDGYRIEARWTPVVRLRAVDGKTGLDIPEIDLVDGEWLLFPTVPRVDRQRFPSPVEVPARDSRGACRWNTTRAWWVRAPGYAWTRTEVDYTVAGEHVVELLPGGGVRVQLLGPERKWTAAVYLIRVDAGRKSRRIVWPTFHPELPMDLEGLAPGQYRLEVWGTKLLAERVLSVRAGKVTEIELQIPR